MENHHVFFLVSNSYRSQIINYILLYVYNNTNYVYYIIYNIITHANYTIHIIHYTRTIYTIKLFGS